MVAYFKASSEQQKKKQKKLVVRRLLLLDKNFKIFFNVSQKGRGVVNIFLILLISGVLFLYLNINGFQNACNFKSLTNYFKIP